MKALRAMPRYRTSGHPFSSWLYQISATPSPSLSASGGRRRVIDAAVEIADPARPSGGKGVEVG